MPWLVLSYTLPTTQTSSPRVNLWRRLRRLGAIAPTGGVHILPAREPCLEALQWLVQEIRQAHGDALLMHVATFDGLTDAQVIDLFCTARAKEYAELEGQANDLEERIATALDGEALTQVQETLARLRRRYTELTRIDYFDCSEGVRVGSQLTRIAQALLAAPPPTTAVPQATLAAYRERIWVTRPRPHVDRLACAWLIRRYINAAVVIRYATTPAPEEVAFDMPDVAFGHHGNRCSFETMLEAFGLAEPALRTIAELVHEIDLRDGVVVRPEVAGIDAILDGWRSAGLSDHELERRGITLFEGLYQSFAASPTPPQEQTEQQEVGNDA
jgi:hypothetical protein